MVIFMKFDLHTHTKYSDGDLDINGNVKRTIELGLDGIAISDHDNIDSWKEIDANSYDISVIKGVELSTYYNNENIHVLGYYLNDGESYEELDSFLTKLRKERFERVNKIINLLKPMGIDIKYEDVIKFADGSVGRPHIAMAIMEKYPEKNYDMQDIFDLYIGNDAPAYVKTSDFEMIEAIKLLKRNHCLVVLAHPLLIKKQSYKDILELGFDGIETFYPYDEFDYREVYDYVKDKDYIITGGSDYHGPVTRDTMGKSYLEGDYLAKFLQRINK